MSPSETLLRWCADADRHREAECEAHEECHYRIYVIRRVSILRVAPIIMCCVVYIHNNKVPVLVLQGLS